MNVYGRKDAVIFLEFNTIIGTDSICFIDGRLNNYNMEQRIIEKARDIRKHRPNLQLVSYGKRSPDTKSYSFPNYVLEAVNNDK